MAIQTLYTAATGMESMQFRLDTIANNLANVNTTAFKRDRANFEDTFYLHPKLPGAEDADGNRTPTGIHVGLGSRPTSTQSDFRQGALDTTNKDLDLAIEGRGFFQVRDPVTQQTLYTRAGSFSVNADGQVVMASAGIGRLIEPPIQVPPETIKVEVSPQGIVSILTQNDPNLQPVGNIELAQFVNQEGMLKLGENLYAQTDASGDPISGQPGGPEGLGQVRQGRLEQSNVEPVRELIDLITTQRAFEMNSQAVQAADQMLQLVANMRRF
jgi:flagellar basal-body rod protein FlgG